MGESCMLGQACANEASSEKMNMYNKAQKSNSQLFDENYDKITWGNQDSPVIPSDLTWFGYRHMNGTLHVKRYLSAVSFKEAQDSDFVLYTFGPFEAPDRASAELHLKESLKIFAADSKKRYEEAI